MSRRAPTDELRAEITRAAALFAAQGFVDAADVPISPVRSLGWRKHGGTWRFVVFTTGRPVEEPPEVLEGVHLAERCAAARAIPRLMEACAQATAARWEADNVAAAAAAELAAWRARHEAPAVRAAEE